MRPAPHPLEVGSMALLLPVPTGDPSGFRLAAGLLRTAAEDAAACRVAATGTLPTQGWGGPAAEAAQGDAHVVGARISALADRLTRAGAVLEEYGHALDEAQRVTTGLQTSCAGGAGGAGGAGDLAATPDVAGFAGRYAAALADLHLAGQVAAHRLRALSGEVGEGPVGRGGQTSARGWTGLREEPDPRAAAWWGLEVVAGQHHRDEAEEAARRLVATVAASGGPAADDPWAVDAAATELERWGRDPVFGAALWAGSTPGALASLVAATDRAAPRGPDLVSGHWLQARRSVLLTGLGASLATFVNPAYGAALDPVTGQRVAAARQEWLAREAVALSVDAGIVAAAGTPTDTDTDTDTDTGRPPVRASDVQGRVLAGMGTAGLSPGAAYASSVGVALVAAEGSTTGPGPHPGADPVLALTRALHGDLEAARAWLLHPVPPLPGGPGGDASSVVEQLVRDGYLGRDPAAAAELMGALGHLVLEAGGDPTSAESTLLAAGYLDAVGRTLQDSPHPTAFTRALAPALDDLGRLLGGHADAVTAVLDASGAPGTDRVTLTAHDRLVRQGRDPGTWEVVLADRPTTVALVESLALGGTTGADAWSPALTLALGGMGATLEGDVVRAVAAGPGSAADVEVTARRLGSVTGFVLMTAGTARAGRAADTDARHRALAGVADLAIGKVSVPGAAGTAVTPLVRAAASRTVDLALPSGAEAAEREATTQEVAARREQALVAGRALVSRAQPWSDAQSPVRWAVGTGAARSPTPFWDAAGIPLPEDVMTTAQRRSFTDWRRDEGLTVYDTVPLLVRDGIDAGVREAGGRG